MKCLYCHARVAGRPETCPKCGYDLASVLPPISSDQSSVRLGSPRFRIALIGLMAGAVIIGLLARTPGSDDTSGSAARRLARIHASNGFQALLEGDYSQARQDLGLAVREDEHFAEAHLGRSMALLALGDFTTAAQDARRARELLSDGHVDQRVWSDTALTLPASKGVQMATRFECVAELAGDRHLAPTESPRLLQLVQVLTRADTCAQAAELQEQWVGHEPSYGVLAAALSQCPKAWPCRP